MRMLILLLSLLPAPQSADSSTHVDYMDAIEAQVKLPPGAATLDRYARYYAFDGQGKVVGVYVIPEKPISSDKQCEELTTDFKSAPCTADWREKFDAALTKNLKANQRRWVEDDNDLPIISDGGCGVITVIYVPKTKKIASAT